MLEDTFLGDAITMMKESGCSTFFVTSSALSIFNAKKNRENSLANAEADEQFQQELERQKELFEDQKEAEEQAFKSWLKHRQREYARIESSKKLETELLKSDLKMFFSDWPLHISINAINEQRKYMPKTTAAINIIVAKHSTEGAKDIITQLYPSIVDQVKAQLKSVGISEKNIYRFRDGNKITGGPALANIYAMMNCLPTVVILPIVNNLKKSIDFCIGCWNQDSLFPLQKKAFSIEYDKILFSSNNNYFDEKIREIVFSISAIAAVLNDTYRLTEGEENILFSTFVRENNLAERFPTLISFAKKEYQSILTKVALPVGSSSTSQLTLCEIYDNKKVTSIKSAVNSFLESL